MCYGGRGSHGFRKPCKAAIGFAATQKLVDHQSVDACCEASETMPATAWHFVTILTANSRSRDAVALPKGWARYVTDRRLEGSKSAIWYDAPCKSCFWRVSLRLDCLKCGQNEHHQARTKRKLAQGKHTDEPRWFDSRICNRAAQL